MSSMSKAIETVCIDNMDILDILQNWAAQLEDAYGNAPPAMTVNQRVIRKAANEIIRLREQVKKGSVES